MSQKKIKGVQLNFTIKEIRQIRSNCFLMLFLSKEVFKKVSKFEKDFWHTLKDICNDEDDITEVDFVKKEITLAYSKMLL